MQGNLLTTVLALIFYLASSIFGGNSAPQPVPSATTNPSYSQTSNYPRAGKVAGKQASLRDNYQNGSSIATLSKGANLLVLGEKGDWYQVQTDDSREGWIPKWAVSLKSYSSGIGNSQKIIAGYYVENYTNDPVGYQSLSQNLGAINMVIPFSFQVDQYGTIKSSHNSRPVALAHSAGADTLALVNNIQGGNFSGSTINRMLSNSSSRSRAISGIVRTIVENGYQGVNIDFENVPAGARQYLTAFFQELAAELRPKNLLVTASVPAKSYDDRSSNHGGAYDYRAIAPYLDQVMIMTYDEHYAGGPAGPVASYPWVEKVVNYALNYFPNSKIVLGIAAYGYDWSWTGTKALHYSAIQSLIKKYHVIPKWDAKNKVPYFTYKSWGVTHQVWYENRNSTAAKVDLVRNYNLRGVAVWRLGYEDPGIWSAIQQHL
ncbi:MAG: glycosyl hydrolase family 18 protein [Bacillota bacterium]